MTLEIFHFDITPLFQFFHNHHLLAGWFTFFVVFCEAMAVIGVVIPGTITMTAIGVLAGSGVIPIASTFYWAIAGAILGDYLSYLIGVYYKDRLHHIWPFKKHPRLLLAGEKFFAKHGGKSVAIGRFAAPMRAMIPMIAGMLKMPQGRFLLAAIPSATIWAVLYIAPGVLLGALALQLPPKVATQFMLWAMGIVVAIWLIIWLTQHFLKGVFFIIDTFIMKLWLKLTKKPMGHWLTNLLADPREPDNHQQLTLLFSACLTLALFLIILFSVLNNGILTGLNQPLYHLLQSIRTRGGDSIMMFFTSLVEPNALLIGCFFFGLWLLWKRYFYTFWHLLGLLLLTESLLCSVKLLAHIPRPSPVLYLHSPDYSFPSGHTALGITVYGFLAMIISRELKEKHWIPYTVASCLVITGILSRLYLGVHWLTDTLGSLCLFTSIVFLITISYRKRHTTRLPAKTTTITASLIFALAIASYNAPNFHQKLLTFYSPYAPSKTIDIKTWHNTSLTNQNALIPLYRQDRLGKPINAFNIQYLGDLNLLEQTLINAGWQSLTPHFNLRGLLDFVLPAKTTPHIPVLTQLYNNRKEALLMIKNGNSKKPTLILRLWDANISVANSPKHFWLGVVDYYAPQETTLIPSKLQNLTKAVHASNLLSSGTKEEQGQPNHQPKKFTGLAIDAFIPYLDNMSYHIVAYPNAAQPPEMRSLDWNGKVVMVEGRK